MVSINLCTDHLLFLLAEPRAIASLSYLSGEPAYSYIADGIEGIPLNNGLAEEVIPFQPDLVLAGDYSDPVTVHFLRKLGYRVEQIAIPRDIADIEQGVRKVSALLDEPEKGAALIESMRSRLRAARARTADGPLPLAVILAPNGFSHGSNTLKGALLELAGFRNLAAELGMTGSGNLSLEQIVAARPDYVIIEDSAVNRNSLAQRLTKHPALTRGLPHARYVELPANLWSCGGPALLDALELLMEIH